jgi:hypothetical protein
MNEFTFMLIGVLLYFAVEFTLMYFFPKYHKFRVISDHEYNFDYNDDYCLNNEQCIGSYDRKWMPQIDTQLLDSQYNFSIININTSNLFIIQKQINKNAVFKLCNLMKNNSFDHSNYIVVSNDNFVVDGNHRWGAYHCFGQQNINVKQYNATFVDIYNFTYYHKNVYYVDMNDNLVYFN